MEAAAKPLPKARRRFRQHSIQRRLGSGFLPELDWTGPLYQSANRYAHLYFLTEIAKIRAFLVNVYFINDDPRPRARTTREDWDAAIERVDQELGLTCKVPHSAAVFLTAQ